MKFEIKISKNPIDYLKSQEFLEKRVSEILEGKSQNLLWILEHPNLYTGGTSSKINDLLDKNKFPTYKTSRGGQWTFHGEGQKIVYFCIKLNEKNIRKFVRKTEEWIIEILKTYNIKSFNDEKNIGIWVKNKNKEIEKIAAIGIRVRKWVAFHGFSLNLNVNKSNYNGIIPCGIRDKGIANITDFIDIKLIDNIDDIIIKNYKKIFEQNLP